MYINGFKNKNLDGKTKATSDEEAEKMSKKEIMKSLENTNKDIIEIIKDKEVKEITFFNRKATKLNVISWLMQHEQLHFGKLMIYYARANIKQSKSLKSMWGDSIK